MAEVIAPAPPGVQSTFDRPLGPQPSKSERAGKWKKAFDELTHEDVKPQGQETPLDKPSTEVPAPAKSVESTKEPSKETPVAAPSDKKPESPLDAVLAKTPKETPPVEEPDVLKEFDEKTANWQRAREVMKTQSGELKTIKAELAQLKSAPKAEPSVIAELTRQRDEIQAKFQKQEENLKAISYQYSDEYQSLLKDRDNIVGKISSRVKSYGGDANALVEALALPEGKVKAAQIKEALSELDPDDKPRIHALIETLETKDEQISDATRNSVPKWDELTAKRDARIAEESQTAIKQLETEYRKVADELPNEIITMREVPDDVPDGTNWNKDIREADEIALRVLKPNGADFRESAMIAKQGAHYPFLMKRYLALHSDHSELKSKYNELAGSGPDFKGGNQPAQTPKPGPKGAKAYHETLAAVRAGAEF